MGRIAILPTALANQIAAGEIIERPASIVKELVENALDAGATRVAVSLRAGGCEGVVVRDDGEGMSREDAGLAFARHATSKIRSADDLLAIGSFGFRGEALPSIAAAADVELLTRRHDADAGTRVRTVGGEVAETVDAGCPPGTRVEVRELFAALPARRKFLKRPATEFGHVAEIINRLALAVPGVGFTLEHDGREVASFPPVAAAADRLRQVLGRDAAQGLVGFGTESAGVSVHGYLGRPEHSLSSARLVLSYVNGRFVRDRVLTRAILDGYESLLMRGRYPVVVVFLRLGQGEVDVNVHPTKAEVRFRDSGRVHRLLVEGIRGRLRDALGAGASLPRSLLRAPPAAMGGERRSDDARPDPRSFWREHGATGTSTERAQPAGLSAAGIAREGEAAYAVPPRSDASPAAALAGAAGAAARLIPARGPFASLRVLGQVLDGYLVCAGPDGLVLIDQHAAHERVRFERLREQLETGRIAVQQLLVPEPLALGVRDAQALEDAREALARVGFEGEPFGDGIYLLRAVPAVLADADCAAVLRDLAADLAEGGASRALGDAVDGLLARVACHSAVRIGRRLDVPEAEALLASMDEVERAGYCPHGRPSFIEIDAAALERMFKR